MASNKVRVVVSRNAVELLELGKKIYAKHTELAGSSPLNMMQSHKWEDNGPRVANALELHSKAEEYKRLAEEAYRERDLLVAEIDESVKASRDLLLGVYRDNPKQLGQWGFEVNDTAKAAKKAE